MAAKSLASSLFYVAVHGLVDYWRIWILSFLFILSELTYLIGNGHTLISAIHLRFDRPMRISVWTVERKIRDDYKGKYNYSVFPAGIYDKGPPQRTMKVDGKKYWLRHPAKKIYFRWFCALPHILDSRIRVSWFNENCFSWKYWWRDKSRSERPKSRSNGLHAKCFLTV